MQTETITKVCPNCGARMPVNFGFPTWCDQCNYNLENFADFPEEKPKGLFPRLWAFLGKRSSERLFKEALEAEAASSQLDVSFSSTHSKPRVHVSVGLAYGVALLVHGFTLLMVVAAVTWLFWAVRDWGKIYNYIIFFRILGAVLLLLITWKVRPRIIRMPKDGVRREQALQSGLQPLFALVDRICQAAGAPPVQVIWITPSFNAAMAQVSWKRERVLMLGLPLLLTLEPQELVALIGHEMAHSVNGDPQRTWIVSSAISTLMQWSDLFYIDRIVLIGGLAGILNLVIHLVMFILSLFAWVSGYLLALLLFPNMQRAEYRADALAACLAGTEDKLSLLRRLYLRQATHNIFNKARFYQETQIMREIHERMCNVPDREWLRIDRIIEKGESRLDDTHPTTKNRVAFLRTRIKEPGMITLSMAEFGQIMDGLKGFEEKIEAEIYKALPAVKR